MFLQILNEKKRERERVRQGKFPWRPTPPKVSSTNYRPHSQENKDQYKNKNKKQSKISIGLQQFVLVFHKQSQFFSQNQKN